MRGEGKGECDRSEKVVVGESVPEGCEDDFQPNKFPSLPTGDFARGCRVWEESDAKELSDRVLCTPSACNVIEGV